MTEYIADPHRECPACGAERERLARHWTSGSCPHPHVEDATRDLLTGLVIGNATAAGNGQHNHVVFPTQHREFALWVHGQLGWLSHGVRQESDTREDREPRYRVRTHAHPALNRYRAWYKSGDKRVPESVALTPRSARAWYACDGGLDYHREDSPPRVTFSAASSDARRREVARLVRETGYDPDVYDRRVRLSVGESAEWLSWIGAPVPGVEHKWLVKRVWTGNTTTPDSVLVAALQRLAHNLDASPTAAEMNEQGMFSAKAYQNRFGSWNEAIAEAGLDPTIRSPMTSDAEREATVVEELETVADDLGHAPTIDEFESRATISPRTVYRVFESWDGAVAAAGLPPVQRDRGEIPDEDLIDELQAATMAIGRPPTGTEMRDYGEYSASVYRKRFGSWQAALEAAGVADDR